MSERAAILFEVCDWAAHKRDGGVRGPDLVMQGRHLDDWRDGYYAAMNEVAQHFNMERLAAERDA